MHHVSYLGTDTTRNATHHTEPRHTRHNRLVLRLVLRAATHLSRLRAPYSLMLHTAIDDSGVIVALAENH